MLGGVLISGGLLTQALVLASVYLDIISRVLEFRDCNRFSGYV